MFVDTLNETKVSFIAGLHAQHSIDPDLILKKKDGALHRAFDSKLTNVMNTYRSITASDATWYVVGDASRIQALLNRVHFIGKRRASGYGRVLSWHCEIFDTNGLTSYGDPLRPIPVDMFDGDRSLPVVDAAWRPAYWDMRNRAACYAPTLLGQ